MTVFEPGDAAGIWVPSPLAAGPFAGLQGGAIAGLLTAEIEAHAARSGLGVAVSASAWFLRPTPMRPLRTQVSVLRCGGRVSIIDNTLTPEGETEPSATVRVTVVKERAVDLPQLAQPCTAPPDPARLASLPPPKAPHGGPWFMDAMEVRRGDGIAWFRMKVAVIAGAGPLAMVLGPADWTHGIARPVHGVLADPNPNLTVHLFRPPAGDWLGVRPRTWWEPARGLGMGSGTLLDREGEIGAVSMAVALLPFPSAAPGHRPEARSILRRGCAAMTL